MKLVGKNSAVDKVMDLDKKSKDPKFATDKIKHATLNRQQQFIANWRQYQRTAIRDYNPQFYNLYNLYDDINDNPIVNSKKAIRINYITSRERMFMKGDQDVTDEVLKIVSNKLIEEFITISIDSKFYGSSLIKINDIKDSMVTSIDLIKRELHNPKKREILPSYASMNGESIDSKSMKNWYVQICDKSDVNYLGIFNKIAPHFLMLKDSHLTLSDYLRKLGVPPVVIKTNMTSEEHINNCMDALQNFKNSSSMVLDSQDEIELVEATNTSSADVFEVSDTIYTNNITSAILGSSSMGDEKSFVGSAEISESIANMISIADMKWVEYWFNKEFLPRLVNLGLTMLEGVELKISRDKKQDEQDLFLKTIELMKAGIMPDPKWVEEMFGIPLATIQNGNNESDNK